MKVTIWQINLIDLFYCNSLTWYHFLLLYFPKWAFVLSILLGFAENKHICSIFVSQINITDFSVGFFLSKFASLHAIHAIVWA